MTKGQTLQDPFLNLLRKEKVPVSVYLVNGIKLQGTIDSFDQFVVLLKNSVNQMVYKHAISTVVPTKNVRLPVDGEGSLVRLAFGWLVGDLRWDLCMLHSKEGGQPREIAGHVDVDLVGLAGNEVLQGLRSAVGYLQLRGVLLRFGRVGASDGTSSVT